MLPLTNREQECLQWASQGKTSWEIGKILGITERTANFHINNACRKLSVRSRQAAIAIALSSGILEAVEYKSYEPDLYNIRKPHSYT